MDCVLLLSHPWLIITARELTPSHWIALFGGALSIILFIVVAYAERSSVRSTSDFLFAGSSLTKRTLANNLAATATSFAGVLLFFFTQTPLFGWIVLAVIVFATGGQAVFLSLVKRVDPSPSQTGSIYRFLLWRVGSPRLAAVANIIVVMNFLIILLIELVIGAGLFAYFTPWLENARLWGMIFFGLLVLSYVIVGGFKTVTFSDTWQFWLYATGLSLAFILVLISFGNSGHGYAEALKVFKTPNLPPIIWLAFLLNVIVVNLTLPSSQISSWQRFASSKNKDEFTKGVWHALKYRFWWVWLIAILLAALTAVRHGPIREMGDIFNSIRNLGFLGSLIVFPLLFVGLLAALVSTADSMFISLLLGIEDFRAGASADKAHDVDQRPIPRLRFLLYGLVALVLAFVLFRLLQALGTDIWAQRVVQLMFVGYGQAILLFPILWCASRSPINSTQFNAKEGIIGLILAVLVLWIVSICGIVIDWKYSPVLTYSGPVVALLIAWLGVRSGTKKASQVQNTSQAESEDPF